MSAYRPIGLRWFLLIVLMLGAASFAWSGSNVGGTLVLYADDAIQYTSDHASYDGLSGVECPSDPIAGCPPYDGSGCATLVDQAKRGYASFRTDTTIVFWVMAVWPATACPRMKGAQFGLDYDPAQVTIVARGTDASFELATPAGGHDWPASGSGVALSWDQAQTSPCKEIYWFAAEVGSLPSEIRIARHPAGNAWPSFADDAVPSRLDAIGGDCLMGLGVAGSHGGDCGDHAGGDNGACCLPSGACVFTAYDACLAESGIFDGGYHDCVVSFCASVAVGACCLATEDACVIRSLEECRSVSGSYYGDWSTCEPLRCTTAIEKESWGGIKHRYR